MAGLSGACHGATRRHAALAGWLFGLGLWVPLLSFLRNLGVAAWVAAVLVESLWFPLLALALQRVQRARWPVLGVAAMWVLQEFLRDRVPFHGFPWGRLAFGQADGPLLRLAAWGGAPLVGFAVALGGAALYSGLVDITRKQRWGALGAAAGIGLICAGPLAIGLPTAGSGTPASAVVAVIQGNVPRLGLDAFSQRHTVTAYHLAETRRLAAAVTAGTAPRPDLVIWPENASDQDPFDDPVARGMIEQAVAAVGVPIVVGAVLDGPGAGHVRNAAVVWTPHRGPVQLYVKRHLVPFGEYIPFRSIVTSLTSAFARVPNDFVPGHRPGLLHAGPVALADAICFEVADDAVVRQAVTAGGRLLVVQTNNADYERVGDSGDGGETAQQLAITRLRAVEHGRAAVVAATSGVSAVVAPDGTVLARTGVYRPASLDMRVPLRGGLTVADRLGPWPERAAAGLAALWLIACLLWPLGRRQPPAAAEPAGSSSRQLDLTSRST